MAYNLLKGKRGIIFGALDENSIAWKVAQRCHEEGATFTLSNAPLAMRMGEINKLAEATGSKVVAADATVLEDLDKLVEETLQTLGGKVDFVLHSIGMSPNIRKGKAYGDLNYDWYAKTIDISALSFHKIIHAIDSKDGFNEYASVLALSYIAAQRVLPDYTDMADAKAILESIARSYGARLGKSKHIRINTISQSPTMTTAGKGISGFGSFFDFADKMSPLGNASADACADYCVTLFSDLTKMVTMQNLFHDGGFSNTAMSSEVLEAFIGSAK